MDHKKFKIYDNNQTCQREVMQYRKDGGKPGVYVGFECLKDFYSVKAGECTDWTGRPTSGKTQMLFEVLINTAKLYGHKSVLYMPDVGEPVEILADILHKVTGKTFDKKYQNVISVDDIYKECPWILEHFKIVSPHKGYRPTPKDFYELTRDLNVQQGAIDSWKDLKHNYSGPINEYLADILTMRNEMMKSCNKHMHTVMHPKLQVRDKNGKFPPPNAYDISGGAAPYDSGRAMIGVNRESIDTNVADVYILKAKPRIVGKKGVVSLQFDVARSRYYEMFNQKIRYAGAQEPEPETKTAIQRPNYTVERQSIEWQNKISWEPKAEFEEDEELF